MDNLAEKKLQGPKPLAPSPVPPKPPLLKTLPSPMAADNPSGWVDPGEIPSQAPAPRKRKAKAEPVAEEEPVVEPS